MSITITIIRSRAYRFSSLLFLICFLFISMPGICASINASIQQVFSAIKKGFFISDDKERSTNKSPPEDLMFTRQPSLILVKLKSNKMKTYINFSLSLLIVILFCGTASAQVRQYRPVQPGYYNFGYQNQAYQVTGTRTDTRGVYNGGVTFGPIGVSGYNNGYTFNYPYSETQYRNTPLFYYSDGSRCRAQVYTPNQLPNGAPVYDQWGRPFRQPSNNYAPYYQQGVRQY